MTLEQIKDDLQNGAKSLKFDIRRGTLWVEAHAGGDALTPMATGSISVDPAYARVSGSATLSNDPEKAEEEARAMLQLARTMRRAQELLRIVDTAGTRRRRRASEAQ